MKASRGSSKVEPQVDVLSDIFHELSQPLTTLECGLELALRNDTTVAQLRKRLRVLLEAAQELHQKLLELRAKQQKRESSEREMQSDTIQQTIPSNF